MPVNHRRAALEVPEIALGTYTDLGKGKRERQTERNTPHRYGNSHAIWDHTVLSATRQR